MTAPRAASLRLGPVPERGADLRAEVSREAGTTVVRLVGEVDSDSAPMLRAGLLELVTESPVLVDLAAVPFLDSAGLSTLVAADRGARAAGHALVVRGACGTALRVIRVSGLHRVLTMDPPVD